MASAMFCAPCSVRATKGLNCQNYVGLRLNTDLKLSASVTIKSMKNGQSSRRLFIVRAGEKRDEYLQKLGMSNEEHEAAVVAGNVPEAPPIPPKPAAPAGTPVVSSLVSGRTGVLLSVDWTMEKLALISTSCNVMWDISSVTQESQNMCYIESSTWIIATFS